VRSVCAGIKLRRLTSELPCRYERDRSAVEGGHLGAIRLSALKGAVMPSLIRAGFLHKEMVYVML
jgi:hypothetical protein